MGSSVSHDRLVAILETQTEIASADLDAHEVMSSVAARARALTGADAGVVELLDGEQLVDCRDARFERLVDADAARLAGGVSMVSSPLIHRGRILGALKVYAQTPDEFDEQDVKVVELLAGLLAPQLAHWDESERRRAE